MISIGSTVLVWKRLRSGIMRSNTILFDRKRNDKNAHSVYALVLRRANLIAITEHSWCEQKL